jgi:hypothetical protein
MTIWLTICSGSTPSDAVHRPMRQLCDQEPLFAEPRVGTTQCFGSMFGGTVGGASHVAVFSKIRVQ